MRKVERGRELGTHAETQRGRGGEGPLTTRFVLCCIWISMLKTPVQDPPPPRFWACPGVVRVSLAWKSRHDDNCHMKCHGLKLSVERSTYSFAHTGWTG